MTKTCVATKRVLTGRPVNAGITGFCQFSCGSGFCPRFWRSGRYPSISKGAASNSGEPDAAADHCEKDSGSLRTYALMLQHSLHDIPVVSKEGKLIGIRSRVDIGVAILSTWQKAHQ